MSAGGDEAQMRPQEEDQRRVLQRIRPDLYRCDLATALDDSVLAELGIEVLVSLVTHGQWTRRGLDHWHPEPRPPTWTVADVEDGVPDPFPAAEWRKAVSAIIAASRRGVPCLVHCSAGRSRSGVAVAVAISRIEEKAVADVVTDLRQQGVWRGCNPRLLVAVDHAVPGPKR